ncbi:MAG: hypothetical protein AAFQ15_00210 [Pseudomonadota bacterium]
MLHASTKKLIDRLAEMTDLAKLDWTEGEDGNITYSTEGYSVSLTETPNEMVITSKDGKELERAGAEELVATPTDDGGTYADIVATMTKEAARVARGTEAAISTLLAGMQEAPAEPIVSEADAHVEEDAEVQLQEDQGDETEVLTDDSVEAVSSETEPATEVKEDITTETNDEPEAAALVETSEETELEASSETEAASELADKTDMEAAEAAVSEEAPLDLTAETVAESDTESEDDVTEAVVRLADEVNQREDTGLDAATASAVGAVALAAGLTTETEESEPEAVEPDLAEPEPVEVEPVSAFAAADETPTAPPVYVPFGLEDAAENEVAAEAETADTITETASESPVESAAVFSLSGAETAEPEAETKVLPTEPATDWAATQTASEETAETVQEPAIEEPAMESVSEPETQDISEPEPEVPAFAMAEPAAEETIESTPVEETVELVSEAPQSGEAQTYSLSGIGAGFGLGALSAKSEASGIPGPTSFGGTSEDKVLIDATEDVLPEIDGKPALPTGVAPLPPATGAEGETAADAEAQDGDADILKPRTRFNPWD